MINEPFNQIVSTRYGHMLVNKNDRYIGKSLILYGEMSEKENSLYRQICSVGANVIEVGSNIGVHSLAISRFITNTGGLFCFEPQRVVYQTLNANLALNSITNTFTYNKAVGNESKKINIPQIDYTKDGNFGGFSIVDDAKGEEINQVILDDFMDLEHLELLKIDVEGMEEDVIKGALSLIDKHKPIIYCENDRQDKSKNLIELLWSLNYKCYWHLPTLFSEDNFNGVKENIFKNLVSVNMFCIHKNSEINVIGFTEITDSSFHIMKK